MESLFEEMKTVVEQEKVEMPSTRMCAFLLPPVYLAPKVDELATIESTPSALSAACPQKPMITIVWPAVKKTRQALASSVRHRGVRA